MLASTPRRLVRRAAKTLLPASLVVFRGPSRDRRVALTFDDGPSNLTPAYLAVLDRFAARATFLVVGGQCEKYPDLVDEMVRRGHSVGVHGYTHRRFSTLSSREIVENEISRTAGLLRRDPTARRWVRPPHGDVTARTLLVCARAGYTTLLWSHDSGDWQTRQPEDVVQAVSPGAINPGAIVLLHEGQSWTLNALDTLLGRLTESGHELVTVDRLLDD